MKRHTTMIQMECDDCHALWQGPDRPRDEICPECAGSAVHQRAAPNDVARMRALLANRKMTPEQLKAAFAACTVDGESFADAVLAKAVESGDVELVDGKVWRVDHRTY